MIDTQNDLLTVLLQLQHTAEELKHVDPALMDRVMIGVGRYGAVDASRFLDAIAFDFRIAQVRLENYRAGKITPDVVSVV